MAKKKIFVEIFLLQNENRNLTEKSFSVHREASNFLEIFIEKEKFLEKIHDRLKVFESERNEFRKTIENLQNEAKLNREEIRTKNDENQNLRKTIDEEKRKNLSLTDEIKHLEQLRQSIVVFEKKLDQKQTKLNEFSNKIIEKDNLIENKVKECQKHRIELKDLENKYSQLGKQLETQINDLTKQIHKLNLEKETLKNDLDSLRLSQQNVSLKRTIRSTISLKRRVTQQILQIDVFSLAISHFYHRT